MTAAMFWWTLVKGHVTRRTDQSFVRAKTLHLETDFFSLSLSLSLTFFFRSLDDALRRPSHHAFQPLEHYHHLCFQRAAVTSSTYTSIHTPPLVPFLSSSPYSLRQEGEGGGESNTQGEDKKRGGGLETGEGGGEKRRACDSSWERRRRGREGEDKRREEVEPLHTTSTQ